MHKQNIYLKVSDDFTDAPGGRHKTDGPCSGEAFRDDCLIDLYKKAKKLDVKITVDLDDTYGYPSSFLDEAFGGLVRTMKEDISNRFVFVCKDEPKIIEKIEHYIHEALKEVES